MIIIDRREKNSMIIAELVERNADIEIRQLEVADYLIGNIAIERKTLPDFINSMINKRLLRQLEDLKQYEKQLLIIEGTDNYELYKFGKINPNAIRGMFLSTVLDFEVPIILTKNSEDTAEFLLLLEKKQAKKPKEFSFKAKRKVFSVAEQQKFILEGFPGIGPATAKKLLEKFRTIKNVINADEKDLVNAKLNKNKAEAVKKIVEEEYRD